MVADLGCGRGLAKLFCDAQEVRGDRWIGLDFDVSHRSLEEARHHELHSCDLEGALPSSCGCFVIAVALHVFEHLADPRHALAQVARVLRPGGVLLVGTPILPRWIATPRKQFARGLERGERVKGQHVQCFSPATGGRWLAWLPCGSS